MSKRLDLEILYRSGTQASCLDEVSARVCDEGRTCPHSRVIEGTHMTTMPHATSLMSEADGIPIGKALHAGGDQRHQAKAGVAGS